MAIKIYSKEYGQTLQNVFQVKQEFLNTFGGQLQVVDGVKSADKFISLKVSSTNVTINNYSTDANVGFGTGTGSTNRFGERTEIKSIDKDVEYEAPLSIHEGVDNMTVNDNADEVIEERAGLHAEAWIEQTNTLLAKALSDNASKEETFTLNEDGVSKVFGLARKEFVNNKVSKDVRWTAYVNTDVYNILVEHKLLTTAKGSTTNIDNGSVDRFKGFDVVEIADAYFTGEESIYFAADNVGVVGIGVEVYRVLDSEDFAGVAIQAAAKFGKYIPEANKKAIVKAKGTPAV